MKFYEDLSEAILSSVTDPCSFKEIEELESVKELMNNAPSHPSGLTNEQLGLPPRPPGFAPPRKRDLRHDLAQVVQHLVRQGKLVLHEDDINGNMVKTGKLKKP